MTNVTILTDENGVQREYREVKRAAGVGELVKGSDGFIGRADSYSGIFTIGASGRTLKLGEYVVLEPTDVVIIDGVRYREERRKARVGERILIVNGDGHTDSYRNGTVLTVTYVPSDMGVCADAPNGRNVGVFTEEYVVLVPIAEPQPSAPQTVINVNLTLTIQPGEDVAKAVADAIERELTKMSAQGRGKSAQQPAAQCLRDEIVGRAKSDVAGLLNRNYPGLSPSVWLTSKNGAIVNDKVEFVVNREKRTVVALVKRIMSGCVTHRGIAKCAPDDCFNVHIGKAIALRRALGLTVPDEYLNAPQPTEVRVGDVVEYRGFKFSIVSPDSGKHGWSVRRAALHSPVAICGHIIDDSRDQTEVSA